MKAHCIRIIYSLTVMGILALALLLVTNTLADSQDEEEDPSIACPYCPDPPTLRPSSARPLLHSRSHSHHRTHA